TSGNATFNGSATLTVTPTTFLPLSSTTPTSYVLIHSDRASNGVTTTGLNFASLDTTSNISVPAILVATGGGVTCDGGPCGTATNYSGPDRPTRRKTAAELGLTGNAAAIYEPLAAAALHDDAAGAALMQLSKTSDVQAAIAATVPDLSGGMRALSVAMTDQA